MRGIIFYLLLFAFIFFPLSNAGILYVGENRYPHLQEAINASSPGDIIVIKAGIYKGASINKPLTLRGEECVIEGDLVINAEDVSIENLVIKDASHAIEIHGNNNRIRNCIIAGNSYGIKIEGYNNTIISNKIFKNKFYGIDLDYSLSNYIEENILYYNMWGIYLKHSHHTYITRNILRENIEGIKVQTSNNNVIKLNNITENQEKGIYLCCKSKDNYIFMNNFIGNKVNAFVLAEKNAWNSSEYGNYWDNYEGNDFYMLSKNNIDFHPSSFLYFINNSLKPEIKLFYPKEREKVSGILNIEGMNEAGGIVEWRIDNGTWNRANGTSFWNFSINTEKLTNGYHSIQVKCGETILEREIYVANNREFPSFITIYPILSITMIFLWKYIRQKGRG